MKGKSQTTAYIGLGGNLGDSRGLITKALEILDTVDKIAVTNVSRMIKTAPLGDKEQPDYLNAVAKISTDLSAEQLFEEMTDIEDSLGRVRDIKWASRTIDLDLLLYGQNIIDLPGLTVPHKQMHLRSFVLQGLCELDDKLIHPVIKQPMRVLAERLGGKDFVPDSQRPQLISVAGIIGAGKTTLAQKLAEVMDCTLLREVYDSNPFLPEVYAGKKELALDSQLFFLNSRFEQLNKQELPSGQVFITDYIFDKEMIYAQRTLTTEQLSIYSKKHHEVYKDVYKPVLVIFLMDSPETCRERIAIRNRPYEQKIDVETLEELFSDYVRLFSSWQFCPVISISTDDFNYIDDSNIDNLANEVRSYIWKSQEQ